MFSQLFICPGGVSQHALRQGVCNRGCDGGVPTPNWNTLLLCMCLSVGVSYVKFPSDPYCFIFIQDIFIYAQRTLIRWKNGFLKYLELCRTSKLKQIYLLLRLCRKHFVGEDRITSHRPHRCVVYVSAPFNVNET